MGQTQSLVLTGKTLILLEILNCSKNITKSIFLNEQDLRYILIPISLQPNVVDLMIFKTMNLKYKV